MEEKNFSTIPRSKYLKLLPIKDPSESFKLAIVFSLFGEEIQKEYTPRNEAEWLHYIRIYLNEKMVNASVQSSSNFTQQGPLHHNNSDSKEEKIEEILKNFLWEVKPSSKF